MLELVRDPLDPTRAALLHWNGKVSTVGSQFAYDGYRYAPMAFDGGLLQHLPSNATDFTSLDELFNEVYALIAARSGLDEDHCFLITSFCFATHFSDVLAFSPCLLLHSPSPSDAIALLRTLARFCRHPMLLAKLGCTLFDFVVPTRLICQADAHFDKLLGALQYRDFGISQGGSIRGVGGPTAIYVGDAELRSPFGESCIPIVVPPVPLLSLPNFGVATQSIGDKLLRYRLTNFAGVKASSFEAPQFTRPIRDVAIAFGPCLEASYELTGRLLNVLQKCDDALRVEIANKLSSVVVEVLRACCHARKPTVHVAEIARSTNLILSRQPGVEEVSARRVGKIVNDLGFRTRKLDSSGRGISSLENQCRRIHELAKIHALPSVREQFPACPYCRDE